MESTTILNVDADRTSVLAEAAAAGEATRVDDTRGAAAINPDIEYERMSEQLRREKLALEQSLETLERTRVSHRHEHSRLESDFLGSEKIPMEWPGGKAGDGSAEEFSLGSIVTMDDQTRQDLDDIEKLQG